VIVIEDVHWSDEEGQEFLAYLIPALARKPVGFILTARLGGRPNWLTPETESLRLEALGEEAALSIVGGILDTLRPGVRREILRRSQGNPLYLEELARSLTDTLDKTVRSVPGTVQGLLQSRIDRLEPPVRLAIQMASVLGPQFSVGLLHRMYALDPQPVNFELALETLEEQAFVEPTEQLGVRRFRHALMQEVAYGGILSRFRKVLHESAAQLGEEHYAERLEAEAPFFAHHYWEAELRERAAPHLFRAAMSAATQYDLYAAERWFEQLSEVQKEHPEVLPNAGDRAAVLLRYGAVLLDRGRYDVANDLFNRLGVLGSQLPQKEWVVQSLRYRGQIAALRGRIDESRQLFEQGLDEVAGTAGQVAADLRTGLGLALYFASDGDAAVIQFTEALELYEQIDDQLGQAKCYINIGNVLDDLQHDRKAAEPSYEKALELIEKVGDRRLKTGVLLNLATLAMERGDWEDALSRLRHIERLAEETGWSFMRFLSLQNQASCDLPLGRLAMGLDNLDTCLREGETMLKAPDRVLIRELQFEAYLSALDIERAAEKLDEAKAVAEEIDREEMIDSLLLNQGRLLVSRGEWKEASRIFSEAAESAVKLGHPSIEFLARAHHYRSLARTGIHNVQPPSFGEIDQRPTRAIVLFLIADAEAEAGANAAVAMRLEESGRLAGELGNIALERAAYERAAEVWRALGDEEARQLALVRAALAMASLEANLPAELREGFSAHPRNRDLRGLVPA
jgi:tetratricopeptide (TPR) repeat protein